MMTESGSRACAPTFEHLLEQYRAPLLSYFRRRMRNPIDAEDAVQDVFVNLSRRAELGSVANIESYIFQAAANHLRDRHRRARARPYLEQIDGEAPDKGPVDEITPEREMLGREAYAAVIAALQALPERPRMIFILNRFEEMTGREIANMLGISQRQVEKDISKVLSYLRERLP